MEDSSRLDSAMFDHLKWKCSKLNHVHDIPRFPCSQISNSSVIGLYFNPLLKGSRTTPVLRFLFPASSKTIPTCLVFGFQLKIFPSRVSEKTSLSFHHAGPVLKQCFNPVEIFENLGPGQTMTKENLGQAGDPWLPNVNIERYLQSKPLHSRLFPNRLEEEIETCCQFHCEVISRKFQIHQI